MNIKIKYFLLFRDACDALPMWHMFCSGLGERDLSNELSKFEFLTEITRSLLSNPSKTSHPHSLRNLAPFSTSNLAKWAHWPSLSTGIQACVATQTSDSSEVASCFDSIMHIKSTSILSSVNKWLLQWIEIANALISRGCSSKTDSKCANGIDVSFRRILTCRTYYRHQKEKFRNFFCVVPFYGSVLIHGLIFKWKGSVIE